MKTREPRRSGIQPGDAVLMAMATCRRGTLFEPLRIQTLMFLIDREVPDSVDGPHFQFRPYRYGPFDRAVFDTLDELAETGHVRIGRDEALRTYALTASGLEWGAEVLGRRSPEMRTYLTQAARWVLSLRFPRLLAAIYHRYPDMATESVALDTIKRYRILSRRESRQPFRDGASSVFNLRNVFVPPTLVPSRSTLVRSEADAMRDAWESVGDDLYAALADFGTAPLTDRDP